VLNFKKIVVYSFFLPVYWLSFLVVRKSQLWVFSAWYGKKYSDNPRYLYEYILKHSESIDVVWLTKCPGEAKRLSQQGVKAFYCYSISGIWFQLRAGTVICTHSIADEFVSFLINCRARKVNLWHGVPLKKIGSDVYFRKDGFAKTLIRMLYPFNYESYFLFASTSTRTSEIYARGFDVFLENVKSFGYPRNDQLLAEANVLTTKGQGVRSRSILYAPTYRNDIDVKFLSADDLTLISDLCVKYNMRFDMKLHPANFGQINIENLQFPNIRFLDQALDLNEILSEYDLLVSDYSGCIIDFLLLDRPILIYAFDYSKYKKDPGLYAYYDHFIEHANIAYSVDSMLEYLLTYAENGLPSTKAELLNFFHDNQDSLSSKRYYEYLSNPKA